MAKKKKEPVNIYTVRSLAVGSTECFVVGATSFVHAAMIISEVIAEANPRGIGLIGQVEKLLAPSTDDGAGYYAMTVDAPHLYYITPNHVTALPYK